MTNDERTRLEALRAGEVAALFDLRADPHGGWSRAVEGETLHLLGVGDCLEWHRITGTDEQWRHLAGGPLALTVSPNGHDASAFLLGHGLVGGDREHAAIPDAHWRTAEPLGEWTLLARQTGPNAQREDAPPGWRPVPRDPS